MTVGASERTVDDDFDTLHQKFEALSICMNNC